MTSPITLNKSEIPNSGIETSDGVSHGQSTNTVEVKPLREENECDKEDSRCPYNHDPEKVAICKQFLKGTCSSLDFRLTHEVISEQLPDCLKFPAMSSQKARGLIEKE